MPNSSENFTKTHNLVATSTNPNWKTGHGVISSGHNLATMPVRVVEEDLRQLREMSLILKENRLQLTHAENRYYG